MSRFYIRDQRLSFVMRCHPFRPSSKNYGWIREDYVVGFPGPRPQEVDCGPWLICSLLPTVTHDLRDECAYYCTPDAGIRVCDPPAVYRPRHPKPPFSTRHSSSTSTFTSAPMRSASSPAQDHCAALCLRVSSSFLPTVSLQGGFARIRCPACKSEHLSHARGR
jgi:hypothetical protein